MRKTIAAASMAVGGLGVLGLGATAIAGAQDDPAAEDEDGGGWVQDAIGGLVDGGTITQEQADAVEEALGDAHADHGSGGDMGHGGPFGFGGGLSTLAESLGLDEDELRSELSDGRTVAEVAEAQGVEVADVVADVLAAHQERVDEAVAEGDLTQEEADEIIAGAEERVTAFVNGEAPSVEDMPDVDHRGPAGPGWGGHGPWGDGDNPDQGDEEPSDDDSGDTDTSDETEGT